MHDGQNLFDPSNAFTGIDSGVDEAVAALAVEGATDGVIVVGIWNTPDRVLEYTPALPATAGRGMLDRFIRRWGSAPRSGAYLHFLVDELKPFIDTAYRTLPDPTHTAIMGSSMGGLISLSALTTYPNVFGAAGCLSTHWPAGGNHLVDYVGAVLPAPGAHRLYFDYGTVGHDAAYEPYQQRMDAHLVASGYRRGQDFLTLKFDGAYHNEAAWRARLPNALRFLLSR